MSTKSSPLPFNAIASLVGLLCVTHMPFLQMLRTAPAGHFGQQLASTIGGFLFMSVFMGPLLIFFEIKGKSREALLKKQALRNGKGFWHFIFNFFRFVLVVDLVAFTWMYLTTPSSLSYVQDLLVALTAATCATLLQMCCSAYMDRWLQSPPNHNSPATE